MFKIPSSWADPFLKLIPGNEQWLAERVYPITSPLSTDDKEHLKQTPITIEQSISIARVFLAQYAFCYPSNKIGFIKSHLSSTLQAPNNHVAETIINHWFLATKVTLEKQLKPMHDNYSEMPPVNTFKCNNLYFSKCFIHSLQQQATIDATLKALNIPLSEKSIAILKTNITLNRAMQLLYTHLKHYYPAHTKCFQAFADFQTMLISDEECKPNPKFPDIWAHWKMRHYSF